MLAGRRMLVAVLAAALALSALGVAAAEVIKGKQDQIIEAGPISAAVGNYPSWYRDAGFTHDGTYYDSVDLEPCLGDRDPLCLPAPAPDPTKPMDVETGNFPDEFFYYNVGAAGLVSNGGNDVLFESALEGAWSAEEVNPGDQVVFGRIRIRAEGLRSGERYTVTHPQGEDTFVAEDARRGINYTQDIAAAPGNFTAAFKSRVGPFLRWAPNADDPDDRPPAGYIGDPGIDHKVVGSPFGTNYVKVTGPEVGAPAGSPAGSNPNPCPAPLWSGPEEDCIYTELFNVMGRESKTGGVETNRASYSRGTDGTTFFDVFARSKGSQSMLVRDGDGTGTTRFATTPLAGRQGKYFAHVGVSQGTLPQAVTVVNTSDDPDTVQQVALKDLVTVTSAVYSTQDKTLTVKAESSDKLVENGAPVAKLSLPDYPGVVFQNGAAVVPDVAVAPATVKVASTQGDVGLGSVVANGPASPALSAVATGPATAEQGSKVTLSALSSLGQITSYAWTAPAGVELRDADTATPSFTVPTLDPVGSTSSLEFALTVTGPAGSQTANVVVKVLAVSTPKAAITPIGTVEQGTQVTLDGSRSTGAATYLWEHVRGEGDPQIALGDATQPTLRFMFPTDVPLDPATGEAKAQRFRLTVTNVRGDTSEATVDLNSASADGLTTTRVRFVPDKARWVVEGTAKLLADNEVTVHAGPTLDGKVIGKATVTNVGGQAQLGQWLLDAPGSDVTLADAACTGQFGKAYCVSVESKRGASLLAVVVDREDRLPPPPAAPAAAAAGAADGAAGAAGGGPIAAAAVAAARAVPVVGATARLAVVRVVTPAAVTPAAIARAGIPVAFTAPAGATVARVRVLTTAGTPLLQTFTKVRGGKRVTVKVRSAKLRRSVRAGKRYVVEVRAGKSRKALGKATRKTIRVR